MDNMESDDMEVTYVPKCCFFNSQRSVPLNTNDIVNGEVSDEDNNSALCETMAEDIRVRKTKARRERAFALPPSGSNVNDSRLSHQQQAAYHDGSSNGLNDLDDLGDLTEDLSKCLDLWEEDADMIRLAGGQAVANKILAECEAWVMLQPDPKMMLSSSSRGDTILMQKCSRSFPESDQKSWQRIYGEIRAFAKVMTRLRPDLLVARNDQEASALDLAALTNKSVAAVYLARLYEWLGHDPNTANSHGHTILHLLARKGDDCATTLEALLRLRKKAAGENERLFRIDVVNKGHKTPLDVAIACSNLFSTGKNRALYAATINLFHNVIIEEASSIMDDEQTA